MREMATERRRFMPPLYAPLRLSPTPPLHRFTLFRDSSTACKVTQPHSDNGAVIA